MVDPAMARDLAWALDNLRDRLERDVAEYSKPEWVREGSDRLLAKRKADLARVNELIDTLARPSTP